MAEDLCAIRNANAGVANDSGRIVLITKVI